MPESLPFNLKADSLEDLQRQLKWVIQDIYSKLDSALGLRNSSIITLDRGGLGKDVSGFNGLLAILGGSATQLGIGDGLQNLNSKLALLLQAAGGLAINANGELYNTISAGKAAGTDIDTGTDDAKFITAKSIKDSKNVPDVAPGTLGNVATSDGTNWISTANKAIMGDATAGRKLKSAQLQIQRGTNASTLKCTLVSNFNGDTIGVTDNITKGATTGNYTLGAGGNALMILAAGLTGNVVGILTAGIVYNDSALAFIPLHTIVSHSIDLLAYNLAAAVDLTTIASGKSIYIDIIYVTSA